MFCENCGHPLSDTTKFCSACGHPVGTTPSPNIPLVLPGKRESPRSKASSGNGSITKMSGNRRKPWLLRMPVPDSHTDIPVLKAIGTYVTREETRELYDLAWKYLRPLWHFKIAALYAQDFQNILDKMSDDGLS